MWSKYQINQINNIYTMYLSNEKRKLILSLEFSGAIISHVYSKFGVSFWRILTVTKICLLYSVHLDGIRNDHRFVLYVPYHLIVITVPFGRELTDKMKLLVLYSGFNSSQLICHYRTWNHFFGLLLYK